MTQQAKKNSRRWILPLSIFLTLVFVFLVLLYSAPRITLQFAQSWYQEQGQGYELTVDDWHFKPFTTRLVLQGIHLQHGDSTTHLEHVTVRFNPWKLWHQEILIEKVQINGLFVTLNLQGDETQSEVTVAGISIPLGKQANSASEPSVEGAEPEEPWLFSLKTMQLNDVKVAWNIAWESMESVGQIQLQQLQLEDVSSFESVQTQLAATFVLDALSFTSATQSSVVLQQPVTLNTQGQLMNVFDSPTFSGRVSIHDFMLSVAEQTVRFHELRLLDVHLNAQQQALPQLLIQQLTFADPSSQFVLEQLTATNLTVDMTDQDPLVMLDELEFAPTSLNYFPSGLSHAMQIEFSNLAVHGMQWTPTHFSLDQVNVKKLMMEGEESVLVAVEDYYMAGVRLSKDEQQITFDLAEHSYQGLAVKMKRLVDGRLQGIPQHEAETTLEEEKTVGITDQANETEPFNFLLNLAEFVQRSETESVIHVEDVSVKPKLDSFIKVQEFSIGAIQAQGSAQQIEMNQPLPVYLKVQVDQFGTVVLNATLTLDQGQSFLQPSALIQLEVKSLDIVDFNGYLIDALGYQLDRGSLDVQANIQLNKGKLKGKVELLLRNSKFVPANEATIQRISKQLSMPLDTAIGLLRDKQGNVKLSIPLSGDLNDPQFQFGDIARQLTNKAVKNSLLYVLSQSMQPYGGMLSLATMVGEYAFAIRLDALSYADEQRALSPDQQANLAKVAALMTKKDVLEVRACAFVSETEVLALGEDNAFELGRERADVVKQWFVEQHPSIAHRLTLCRVQKGKSAEIVLGV